MDIPGSKNQPFTMRNTFLIAAPFEGEKRLRQGSAALDYCFNERYALYIFSWSCL